MRPWFGEDGADESEDELLQRRKRPSEVASASDGNADEGNDFEGKRLKNDFILEIHLLSGTSLAIRDKSGTSDPYVKFKVGGQTVYKSKCIERCLNPKWNEKFTVILGKIDEIVNVKVYDSNWGMRDDFMGRTRISPSSCRANEWEEVALPLVPRFPSADDDEDLGFLRLRTLLLNPIADNSSVERTIITNEVDDEIENKPENDDDDDDEDSHRRVNGRNDDDVGLRRRRSPNAVNDDDADASSSPTPTTTTTTATTTTTMTSGLVTVVVREAVDLPAMDLNGLSDPYIKVRLGSEKRRSKVKNSTLNPRWFQNFEFQVDDLLRLPHLRFDVYDRNWGMKDDYIGKASVDLTKLSLERTHHMQLNLDEEGGVLKISVTVTSFSSLEPYSTGVADGGQVGHGIDSQTEKYFAFVNTFQKLREVGRLNVNVVKAEGLRTADFNGSSDPFVLLQLVNTRLKTKTVHKTVDPEWNKEFAVAVKDISSVLEIHVLDENRSRPPDFLGRIEIPLLSLERSQKKWFQLKDEKLKNQVKGRLYLELELVYNPVRAAFRLLSPREQQYKKQKERKANLKLLKRNYEKIMLSGERVYGWFLILRDIVEWKSPLASIVASFVYVIGIWYFDLYFVPLGVAMALLVEPSTRYLGRRRRRQEEEDDRIQRDEETKRSMVEDSQLVMDLSIQMNMLFDVATTFVERLRNLFSWSTPFLSSVMLVLLVAATFAAFVLPPKIIFILFGIHLMSKKFRGLSPFEQHIFLDYLKRVPTDEEIAARQTQRRSRLRESNLRRDDFEND